MNMKRIVGFILIVICVVSCKKSKVTPTAAERFESDLTLIDKYLADNHIDAIRYDSIRYVINVIGTGPTPTKTNCVLIKYSGFELEEPTAFQVNVDKGLKLPLKGLIGGMQIALKKFPLGSKGWIYMPSALGYGVSGQPDGVGGYAVHPNTCLRFEVELVQLYEYNVLGNYCNE